MYDIITFGSATRDIFLKSKTFKIVGEKKFITGKGLCLSLGSKIEVEDISFTTGGGGTNTAATFANQGFKTAYCGMVGDDPAGDDVIQELKKFGIDTQFILKTKKKPTNQSVILSSDGRERTIIVYRGASGELTKKDIPWSKLKSKWFYLAPLSGKLCNIFESLVNFAKKNKIKIAVNPGNCQLSLPAKTLERILKKVDILILNQEEASLLTKIPYQNEVEIFKKIDELCPGIAIMTKGPSGVVVSNGKYLYRALPLKSKVADRTGAGDSFASGFLSGYIQSKGNIVYAIQLGMANSAACLQKVGAKNGLLKKGQKFVKVKVQKELCLENNRCLIK
jgi:ribokinase